MKFTNRIYNDNPLQKEGDKLYGKIHSLRYKTLDNGHKVVTGIIVRSDDGNYSRFSANRRLEKSFAIFGSIEGYIDSVPESDRDVECICIVGRAVEDRPKIDAGGHEMRDDDGNLMTYRHIIYPTIQFNFPEHVIERMEDSLKDPGN